MKSSHDVFVTKESPNFPLKTFQKWSFLVSYIPLQRIPNRALNLAVAMIPPLYCEHANVWECHDFIGLVGDGATRHRGYHSRGASQSKPNN